MNLLKKIKLLPKEISDKIAAGEVVERPLSIVKELMENSIDAGATAIVLEMRNGGKSYIRVTDDGSGIEKEDVPLAFARYATSKISTEEDLYAISSLGFRGEALASIAAVSKVELITKVRDSKTGTKILFEGGHCMGIWDTACEEGSTIIITDLFYNTPVRKKFLKPDNTESALIIEFVSKMALAYPQIKIRLINNGSILFSTPGKGNLYQCILTVYSKQTAAGLIEINATDESEGLQLKGYISSPDQSRTNQKQQIFFVNGRWIKSKLLEIAVKEAYSDKLFEGRYPSAFLFLTVDPHQLDVNIHPNKTEVLFYDEKSIKEFIIHQLRRVLLQEKAAPSMGSAPKPAYSSPIGKDFPPVEQVNINSLLLAIKPESHDSFFAQLRGENLQAEGAFKENAREYDAPDRFFFTGLNILGSVFATYVVACDEHSMYLVDQHAAHERVLFERILKNFLKEEAAEQMLLAPLIIEIAPYQKVSSGERLELLKKAGYHIEEFGPKELLIKSIPACMDLAEAESFLYEVLEREPEDPKASPQEKLNTLISAACKAAVKANDRLSEDEIRQLFIALDGTENPFSCPHGRPTFIKFSLSDMDKLFKRK